MTLKIRPLHDRVLVRRADEETKTAGGILIPGSATEKPLKGLVVAVGTGKALDNGSVRALAVSVGDEVYFTKYAGTEIKIDGVEYMMMREEDLMAVIVK
jgi:chaperonin GroES